MIAPDAPQHSSSRSRAKIYEVIFTNMTDHKSAAIISHILLKLLGEEDLGECLKKLCQTNDFTLLRILTIIVYKADILYGIVAEPINCYYYDNGDNVNLYISLSDGNTICIGLTTIEPYIPISCNTSFISKEKREEREASIGVKIT